MADTTPSTWNILDVENPIYPLESGFSSDFAMDEDEDEGY